MYTISGTVCSTRVSTLRDLGALLVGLVLLPEIYFSSSTLAEIVAPVRVITASSSVVVAAPTVVVVLALVAALPKKMTQFLWLRSF